MKQETKKCKPFSLLIYGTPKIGLSTLASQLPDPLFLNLDDDLTYLNPKKEIKVASWNDFIKAGAREICEGKHPSGTLVASQIERLWQFVCDHVTTVANGKNGTRAKNISELSFADWRQAIDIFEQKLKKLTSLGNTVFLSHEIAEIRNIRGIERTHFNANLERKAQIVVLNLVDATGRFYSIEQDVRVLSFVSQENQITGSRIPELQNHKLIFQNIDLSSFTRVIQKLSSAHHTTRGTDHEIQRSNKKGTEDFVIERNRTGHN